MKISKKYREYKEERKIAYHGPCDTMVPVNISAA